LNIHICDGKDPTHQSENHKFGSHYHKAVYKTIANAENRNELGQEAYLVFPADAFKLWPRASGADRCKYVHHIIEDNENMILSVAGLKKAAMMAKRDGTYAGKVKEHIERHLKEVGLFDDQDKAESYIEEMIDLVGEYILESGNDVKQPGHEAFTTVMEGFKSPKDLFDWMRDNLQYGLALPGGKADLEFNEEDFLKKYRLQSPAKLMKSKVGVCWDQVEFERVWFEANGFDYLCLYLELDLPPNYPTHTTLIYRTRYESDNANGRKTSFKHHWFEHSWLPQRGIHNRHNDLPTLIHDIIKRFRKSEAGATDESRVTVRQLNAPKYGSTCNQYMQFARSCPELDIDNCTIPGNKTVQMVAESTKIDETVRTTRSRNGVEQRIKASVISQAQCDSRKNLTKQFKKDGHTFYSAPGKEQYTWNWYAVPYGQPVTEGVVFAEDDVSVNLDKWPKKKNMLFITGHSGSGKTTIAEDMAKAVSGTVVQFDWFACNHRITLFTEDDYGAALVKKYFNDVRPDLNNNNKDRDDYKNIMTMNGETYRREFQAFFNWLTTAIQKDSDRLYVLEGLQLIGNIDISAIEDYPIMIKGTSVLTSMIQRYRRDKNTSGLGNLGFIGTIKWYLQVEANLKRFKDKLKETTSFTENKELEAEAEALLKEDEEMKKKELAAEKKHKAEQAAATAAEPDAPPEADVESMDADGPPPVADTMPKQTDADEEPKNGVARKALYIAFIEYAKSIRPKNTFGSFFDKDGFRVTYPFVPDKLRYFYRLANPLLCVLDNELTFFASSELGKVNKDNPQRANRFIFAAQSDSVIAYSVQGAMVEKVTEEALKANKPGEQLANGFDKYLEQLTGHKLDEPV
jgi:uridine kinase